MNTSGWNIKSTQTPPGKERKKGWIERKTDNQ